MPRSRWLFVLVLLLPGCAGVGPDLFDARPTACLPDFANHGGWYGGDIASSIPLDDTPGRVRLWLFGDSFVEQRGSPGRRAYPYVSNSIGLSRCDGGGWHFEAYWEDGEASDPRPFFVPDPEAPWVRASVERSGKSPWYWPLNGFAHEGRVYVGLLRVEAASTDGPFRLPFRSIGVDLATIRNPSAAPTDWKIETVALSEAPGLFPVSAFVVHRTHVYAAAFFDRGDGRRPRGLVRWLLSAFVRGDVNLEGFAETLGGDGRWHPGLDLDAAAIVFESDATEMSLYSDPLGNGFVAVSMSPGTSAIHVRRAEALAGPWTERRRIHAIPPAGLDGVPGMPFCYAAKAHPGLGPPDRLWLTWVCSRYARNPEEDLPVLRALQTYDGLYRPTSIEIDAPR